MPLFSLKKVQKKETFTYNSLRLRRMKSLGEERDEIEDRVPPNLGHWDRR
jgi:hypothetical protein